MGLTTIVTRVRDRATATADRVAMREKDLGVWQEVTWARYWDSVLDVAHAYLALGIEPGDRIAIQSENRREWLYADLAAVAVRAATVGLYPTNPPPEVGYLIGDSGARILWPRTRSRSTRRWRCWPSCPDLEHIVYLEPRGIRRRYDNPRLLGWDALLTLGARASGREPRCRRGADGRCRPPTTSPRSSTPPARPAHPRARC